MIEDFKHRIVFLIISILSIGLIVGGFFCPPMGVIDGSVLTASGELLGLGLIWDLPYLLRELKSSGKIKISKGNFSAEVESNE